MYTTTQVANLFEIAGQTVRTYASEFAEYLSPTANPESGRPRHFTDEDLTVFALIVEMKGQGRVYEDIHVALRNGDRVDPPRVLPSGENNSLSATQQLTIYQQRVRELESQLDQERGANKALQNELAEMRKLLYMLVRGE